jgi:23S rRNA (cytosine1962-C5)-methyltransferase
VPRPKITVSQRGAARARDGQPWIYRTDVLGDGGDAEEVTITDERGRDLAVALWVKPPAPIALRVLSPGASAPPFDDLLQDRLAAAVARRGGARLCRLVHAEADGIPGLFVDRYEDVAVVQAATAAIDRREAAIARALVGRLGVRLVVARDDGSARDLEALPRRKAVLHGAGPTRVRVREGAAVLELDVLEDAKTGGFLDQRENHARVAELARGEALDAFTYHGGFALALAPRAASVLALDQDPRAVERARANAAASGFANVSVETADAFVALRGFEREGRRFDVVVIDPPALAKRRGPLETALRAYTELNLRAFRITAPDGWLVTCSCSGKVTPAAFEALLVDAARAAGRQAVLVERRGAAADHPALLGVPETDYLKCFILRVM